MMVMPVGPLMREHRLIEQMIGLLSAQIHLSEQTGRVDPQFIDAAVDFIRTYADRLHHGKEEGILFRDLESKPLIAEHRRIMVQLVEEHRYARSVVGELVAARTAYGAGGDLAPVVENMRRLVTFYPRHIALEDKGFFLPVMKYFDAAEQKRMLEEFRTVDEQMIHEKYRSVVESWSHRTG